MTIIFLCNEISVYGPDGWSPDSIRLGGTEESIVEWAREFVRRGFRVEVYHNGKHGNFDGVNYLDRKLYRGSNGLTINVKSSDVEPQERTWYLTNEMNAGGLELSKFDGVILPSKWAVDNLDVKHPNIQILPHGYDKQKIYPEPKILKQSLYASSPDRGLELALAAWPNVYTKHPDATFVISYGYSKSGNGVIALGDVDENMMNDLYKTSDVWVYPCTGGELFGMSAVKAQAAGCVPLYFPTMALEKTVRVGVKSTPENLERDWIKLLNDLNKRDEIRAKLANEQYIDWVKSSDTLQAILGF